MYQADQGTAAAKSEDRVSQQGWHQAMAQRRWHSQARPASHAYTGSRSRPSCLLSYSLSLSPESRHRRCCCHPSPNQPPPATPTQPTQSAPTERATATPKNASAAGARCPPRRRHARVCPETDSLIRKKRPSGKSKEATTEWQWPMRGWGGLGHCSHPSALLSCASRRHRHQDGSPPGASGEEKREERADSRGVRGRLCFALLSLGNTKDGLRVRERKDSPKELARASPEKKNTDQICRHTNDEAAAQKPRGVERDEEPRTRRDETRPSYP